MLLDHQLPSISCPNLTFSMDKLGQGSKEKTANCKVYYWVCTATYKHVNAQFVQNAKYVEIKHFYFEQCFKQ